MGSASATDKASPRAKDDSVPDRPGPALCAYTLAQIDAAQESLGDPDLHEGIHLARKAVRRARAVLALGNGLLGPGAGMIDRELRGLNRGLSTLRDAHALVELLERLLRRERKAELRDVLAHAREAAIAARTQATTDGLRMDPGLHSRRALLRVLRAALTALDWEPLTPAGLRMAVADTGLHALQARERACAGGDDADWHRWRRRARRGSHERRALEAANVPVADSGETFDKRTTERLGEAQDLTLLLEHCRRDSPFSKDDRHALRARAEPALQRARRRIARGVAEHAGACATD